MARETVTGLKKQMKEMDKVASEHIHGLENRLRIAAENESWYIKKTRSLEELLKEKVKDCGGCRQCRRKSGHSIFSESAAAIYSSIFDSPQSWIPRWSEQFQEGWIRTDGSGRLGGLSIDPLGRVFLRGQKANCTTTREERKYLREGLLHLEQWHMANPFPQRAQTHGTCSGEVMAAVSGAMKKAEHGNDPITF